MCGEEQDGFSYLKIVLNLEPKNGISGGHRPLPHTQKYECKGLQYVYEAGEKIQSFLPMSERVCDSQDIKNLS